MSMRKGRISRGCYIRTSGVLKGGINPAGQKEGRAWPGKTIKGCLDSSRNKQQKMKMHTRRPSLQLQERACKFQAGTVSVGLIRTLSSCQNRKPVSHWSDIPRPEQSPPLSDLRGSHLMFHSPCLQFGCLQRSWFAFSQLGSFLKESYCQARSSQSSLTKNEEEFKCSVLCRHTLGQSAPFVTTK